MSKRDARQVMEDHLRMRRDGDLDGDLRENYHPDVIVLTARKVYRGHDGVRESAHTLWRAVGDEHAYVYDTVMVDDRFALLEWRARTEHLNITCGVDSYVIEDGLIKGQSIHYRVESLDLSVSASVLSLPGELGPSSDGDPVRAPELVDSDA
jgi:hypothetical protein